MANLLYSSKRPNVVKYNNADVHHVVYGGKTIWNKRITVTVTTKTPYTIPVDKMKVISVNGESVDKSDWGDDYVKKGGKIYWEQGFFDNYPKLYIDLWSPVHKAWSGTAIFHERGTSAKVVLEY